MHTSTHYSSAIDLAGKPSISGRRPEVHCLVLSSWTEHSWQRAVCLSAERSISSGWQTDRRRSCRVMSREKRLKTASSPEKGPPLWEERLTFINEKTCSDTEDHHLFTLFRFNVKRPQIN